MEELKTDIWSKYENGVNHHNTENMYRETERNWNFFIGDQWRGVKLKAKNYTPPVLNFIKPIVRYKYSMVAQQKRAIIYSDMKSQSNEIATLLTEFAKEQWERSKMDSLMWSVIKRAAIEGDSYIYTYEGRKQTDSVVQDKMPDLKYEVIHNTNIYFGDEQNANIQEQPYVIIAERIPVSRAKQIAKQNKLSAEKIKLIKSDEELETELGDTEEVKTKDGKCTSLLYFEKRDDKVYFCRSVKNVIYQPEEELPFSMYPIVGMRWEEYIGTCRGVSAVKFIVPNQCAANYNLYRREQAIKRYAFPVTVYDQNALQNADRLSEVGAKIPVDNFAANPIKNLVDYLNPAPISSDANNFQIEIQNTTRELEGASESATGQVDPTKTSGEAIKAARDQSAVPLNEQMAYQTQMIEDLALLWFDMWKGYAVNGMQLQVGENTFEVTKEQLESMQPNVKVDVTPIDPYSVMAEDNNLLNMLSTDKITFDEFVNALSASSNLPKAKLEEIIKERAEAAQAQLEAQAAALTGGVIDAGRKMSPQQEENLQQMY